jgi:4-hydroxy-tetrahydrodipicolinate synthase
MKGDHVLLITPFDDAAEVDFRSLQAQIDFVLSGGVHGVVALGTTGEFFSLTPQERVSVMKVVAEGVRGRVPITFGVGDSGTRTSIALAKQAQAIGASAVMLPPPYYFAHSAAAIKAHFVAVAQSIDIPLMVYDGGGGIELTPEMLGALNQMASNIQYAKLSAPKPAKVAAVLEAVPGIKVFCGDDNMLLLALRHGAVGATIGSGNLQPDVTAGIYDLFAAGDLEGARRLHSKQIAPAVSICGTSKSEYIRCFKEVLAAKGIIAKSTTRLPLLPLDPLRREELFGVMRQLGVL